MVDLRAACEWCNIASMSLRLRLLGKASFERDGQPIEVSSSKAIALLSYLAITRTAQSRDRILSLLWPESAAEAARKNLRNTLWAIRRALGENVIEVEGDRLALTRDAWCDACELEDNADGPDRLEPPLMTWEVGQLLDGFNLTEAPDFEIWLSTTRERLNQAYLHALLVLTEQHQARAEWAQVLEIAHKALLIDNLQEPMYRHMMQAYAQLGQRAEALHAYEGLRKVLSDELGVEPLPETEALRSTILAGSYQPESPTAELQPVRRLRRQPVLGDAPRAPFIGRVSERAMLDQAYQNAQAGQMQIVTITGEMGIGKSRLWQEWSASLPPVENVFETRCLEATQALPFTPLIGLFENSACLRHLVNQPSSISAVWLAELVRVIPALQAVAPHLKAPAALPYEEERRRLFEAFVQMLLAVRSGTLIMFIDDVHWSDNALMDWLGYFANRMRGQGLLLVLTYRREDAPTALVRLVAGWGREHELVKIPLQHLTDQEATALLTALGADPQLALRAQADSAGNPLFLVELCRAWPGADVPTALSDLIRAKLDRLPETTRQVLQAAVILEPEFDFATLRRASGRGEEETLDALDTMLTAGILMEQGGRYRFTHPLVAKVIRDGLSSARKVFLHRRAAEAIAASQPVLMAPIPAQLARHYAEANEPVRAAQYAELAAEQALALAAPAEAIELYRQVVTLDPSPGRRFKLGLALQRAGDVNGARAAFRTALRESVEHRDTRTAGQACLELSSLSLISGRFDETLRWASEASNYLGADSAPRLYVRQEFLLGAGTLQGGGALDEAETHLQRAIQLASEHQLSDMASQSRFELGNLFAQRGELEKALQAYQDSIDTAERLGDQMQEILSHNNYAYHAMLLGRLDEAHLHIDAALTLVDANAIVVPRQYLYSTRGEIALAEAQWEVAELWFQRAITEAERTGNAVQAANSRANMGLAAQGRGDLDTALFLLESAWRAVDALQAPFLQTQIDLWLTNLHLRRGERVAAEQTLRRAEDLMQGRGYDRLKTLAEQARQSIRAK